MRRDPPARVPRFGGTGGGEASSRRLLSLGSSTTSGSGRTARSTTLRRRLRSRADYLVAHAREDWTAEIEGMIADHHKITRSTTDTDSLDRGIPASRLDRRDRWTQKVRHFASVRGTPVRHMAGCRISLASRHVDARSVPRPSADAVANGQTLMATTSHRDMPLGHC